MNIGNSVKKYLIEFFLAISLVMNIGSINAYAKDNTTIIILDKNGDYEKGEIVEVTVGVSSTDGSYLKSANCGFGYNGSTMKLLTETKSPDHFYVESDTPSKWLYYSMKFEMLRDGKMYFIAGAYSGDGVIKAIRADGSRIDLPRASIVYKIGTGIYTKVSDCNLSELSVYNKDGTEIEMSRAFDKNITEYWFDVDGSVDEINISAEVENPVDKVILPDMKIESGENVKEIIVEASDATRKTYILNITRPEQPAIAEDIMITGNKGVIDYGFSKNINEYILEVETDITEITFTGKGAEYMNFTYPESNELKIGFNNKTVTVKTETSERVYSFNIFRKPSNLQIVSLIGELSDDTVLVLDQDFSPEIKTYSGNVKADVQRIKFVYKLGDENDKIIEATEYELKEGINNCTLTVTDGINESTYTIAVFRDSYVRVTQEVQETGPIRNDKEITGFEFKDLKAIFFVALAVFIAISIITAIQLHKRMKDYNLSEEAIAEKEEREREKRLKQKKKERGKKK